MRVLDCDRSKLSKRERKALVERLVPGPSPRDVAQLLRQAASEDLASPPGTPVRGGAEKRAPTRGLKVPRDACRPPHFTIVKYYYVAFYPSK